MLCTEAGVQSFDPVLGRVELLRRRLYGWLGQFRGVATKYLARYLRWLHYASQRDRLGQAKVGRLMLAAAQLVLQGPEV
ncbi:MAG TPA: hypothetical protein VD902_17285 [Symbiobacteriaceae bacterium]|nr:hypothetical protein [Symbiobacteriaceae bacterium]